MQLLQFLLQKNHSSDDLPNYRHVSWSLIHIFVLYLYLQTNFINTTKLHVLIARLPLVSAALSFLVLSAGLEAVKTFQNRFRQQFQETGPGKRRIKACKPGSDPILMLALSIESKQHVVCDERKEFAHSSII